MKRRKQKLHYGTMTQVTLHFRVPVKEEKKQKWKEIIAQHQILPDAFTQFNVCSLHFEKKYILKSKKLMKRAIPTIFGYLFQ